MFKKTARISLPFLICLYFPSQALANGFNFHELAGVAWSHLDRTHYLNLGLATNQFVAQSTTDTTGVWGIGTGYQWGFLQSAYPFLFNLDLTVYTIHSDLSGIETPAVNLMNNADTLNYRVKASNWAWMLEPKFISAHYAWQPYIMFGLGGSHNKAKQYNETPTSAASSAVTSNYFANNTSSHFAWEVGAGVQRCVYTTKSGKQWIVAAEYRYMDWGSLILGTTPAQNSQNRLDFGHYRTNLLDVRFSVQF